MRFVLHTYSAAMLAVVLVLLAVPFLVGGHSSFVAYGAQGDAKEDEAALAAKGKGRYDSYKCADCHGENGEGTPDGPDLTHSRRTRDQVSQFLRKPSSDAVNKGMPDIPLDSPDHGPLVAYVMSIRAK